MRKSLFILTIVASLVSGASVYAVKIADLTHISGQRTNQLVGMGLVVGLQGTGDGGSYLPATRQLASLLEKFHDGVANLKDISNSNNVAIVMVTATIPKDGVYQGDQLDAHVQSIGDAKSLKGGRLFTTPLTGPLGGEGLYALAQGGVTTFDGTLTSGVISQGAQMETDFLMTYVNPNTGKFTLILADSAADWATAWSIAGIINEALNEHGEQLAVVKDPKTVEVTIPADERPVSFIRSVQALPVKLLPTEARVVINSAAHSITMSENVEISPTVIIFQGLTISTVSPAAEPTRANPLVTNRQTVGISSPPAEGAKLQDLINALDQLKVPADDRITIIKELHHLGNLHAKLILE